VQAVCGKRLGGTEVACRCGYTRCLDDSGGIQRDSCLTKRGAVQATSGLEHNARRHEKDTLEMGASTSNNLSGDLPKDALRNPASSTKLDFARGFAGFLGCPMLNSDPLKSGKMSQKSVLLISFFETGTCI